MKTINELRNELKDARLRNEYTKGLQEKKNLQKEINKLKHRNLFKAGEKFKKVGHTISKGLKHMGKVTYESAKERSK